MWGAIFIGSERASYPDSCVLRFVRGKKKKEEKKRKEKGKYLQCAAFCSLQYALCAREWGSCCESACVCAHAEGRMKELVFHVGRLWLLLSSVGLICNVQLSEDGESASICVIWIPITVSTSFIHQPHNSQRRSCSFFLVHFVFSCSSNGSMKQHQLNVHYSGNQYSAALVKNQGNMSWFAHVVFQLRKLCVCWLIGKKS